MTIGLNTQRDMIAFTDVQQQKEKEQEENLNLQRQIEILQIENSKLNFRIKHLLAALDKKDKEISQLKMTGETSK